MTVNMMLSTIHPKNVSTNMLLRPKQKAEFTFEHTESLPASIHSSIQPWLTSHVIAKSHPYVAKTDSDGRFVIKNLPVGQYTFQTWHEVSGYLHATYDRDGQQYEFDRGRFEFEIKPNRNDLGEIHVPDESF